MMKLNRIYQFVLLKVLLLHLQLEDIFLSLVMVFYQLDFLKYLIIVS